MTTDRVFVLLMMVLRHRNCFEATSTTEAQEEQDSTSEDGGTSDNVPNGDSDEGMSSNEPVDLVMALILLTLETQRVIPISRLWYSSGDGLTLDME